MVNIRYIYNKSNKFMFFESNLKTGFLGSLTFIENKKNEKNPNSSLQRFLTKFFPDSTILDIQKLRHMSGFWVFVILVCLIGFDERFGDGEDEDPRFGDIPTKHCVI